MTCMPNSISVTKCPIIVTVYATLAPDERQTRKVIKCPSNPFPKRSKKSNPNQPKTKESNIKQSK